MGVIKQQKTQRALHTYIKNNFHIPILSSLNKPTNITRGPY
jgi:hypothetical protein